MSFIMLQAVEKIYSSGQDSVKVLHSVDITIEEGEFVALIGPSGSGKSTVMSILGGINPPTSGKVLIDDIPMYDLSSEKLADFRHEYIGFVFQQFQLIPYLTAQENIMLPLAISGMSHKDQLIASETALEKVGLAGKGGRLPNQLSGGEQERVAIARAIVNNPPLLLADEPTGSLDTKTGDEIMALFRALNDEGQTIMMVTHNPENAGHADRIIAIRDGRIQSDQGDQAWIKE